jgi:hypothetical protein
VSYQFVPLPKAAKSPWINQRATIRYQCAPATAGRVAVAEDREFQRAWVLDLSSKGIGLELTRTLPIGTLVIVQLKGAHNGKIYEFPAHVIHATPTPTGDYIIGCELVTRLSDEDLEALL